MAWTPGRPLPGSIGEAAERIEQIMAADASRLRQMRAAASRLQHATASVAPSRPIATPFHQYAQASARDTDRPLESQVGPRGGLFGFMLIPRRLDHGPVWSPASPSWLADLGWDTSLSPSTEPVDEKEWQTKLAFDPEGYNSWGTGIRRLWQYPDAASNSETARLSTAKEFPVDPTLQDNEADAFRHALWTYLMTRDIGSVGAKRWHDAHEISEPNDPGVRMMDVFNSRVGIQLALDPDNRERKPEDVIREALSGGKLQTQPFKIKGALDSAPAPGAGGLCTPYQRRHGRC
jgi:hypothetical protein